MLEADKLKGDAAKALPLLKKAQEKLNDDTSMSIARRASLKTMVADPI